MSDSKDVINRAYGGIPKEAGVLVFDFDFITFRGVKYYWYKLVRKFTR
jgi:hypothetical protein